MEDKKEGKIIKAYIQDDTAYWEKRNREFEQLVTTLEPLVPEKFRFLKRANGFTQRLSRRRIDPIYTDFIFRNATLGIKLRLYYFGRLVTLEFIRLEEGKYLEHFKTNDGRERSMSIETIITDILHVSDATIDELQRIRRDSEMTERDAPFLEHILDLYAELLVRHIDTILALPLKTLFPEQRPDNHMSKHQVRPKLENLIEERFAFLQEMGFTAKPKRERETWWYNIFFHNGTIGVFIGLDYFDCLVEAFLMKLQSGELRPHLLVWDQGIRVRRSISELVETTLGIDDPLIGVIRRAFSNTEYEERDYDFVGRVLTAEAQLLHNHIDSILTESLDVLFPPEKPTAGVPGLDFR